MKFANFQNNIDALSNENISNDIYFNKTQNLKEILEINRKINRSLVVEDILRSVIEYSIKITKTERGFILLYDKESEKLNFKLGLNRNLCEIPNSESKITSAIINDVFESGESSFIECAQSDSYNSPSKSIFSLDLQTIMCAPLKTEKEVIGVLYVDSKQIQKVRLREITDTFEILAEQAATAIQNAQTFEKLNNTKKQLEKNNEDLKTAKKAAEKSDRLKTEFLAQMSHEIRTPINSILSFSSLLKDEFENKVNEDMITCFDIINRSGDRIIRTTDLLLNMSEIQTGTYECNFREKDLYSDFLQELYLEYKPRATKKNIKFSLKRFTEKTTKWIDPYTIKQILSHLIDNAIKFTDEGEVKVNVFENEKNQLTIEVNDTGIGISDDYIPELFKPFTQEQQGYTRKYEGNGLGLALIKEYCNLNDVLIDVESEKNVGSTFSLTFLK